MSDLLTEICRDISRLLGVWKCHTDTGGNRMREGGAEKETMSI